MKKHKRLSSRLTGMLGAGECSSALHISGDEVTLYDCERIITYEHSLIVIALRDFDVGIRGDGLELDTYMGERAIIRGRIDSVEILREDGK